MKVRTGIVFATALTLALAAGAASAHPKHARDHVDRPYAHSYGRAHVPARSRHMPHWLHHDKRFRRWYRHSAIRHNPYLPWWKIYRVYERQMARHHYRHHDRWRSHDRYRRYDDDRYDDDRYDDDRYDDDHHDDRPRRRKRS